MSVPTVLLIFKILRTWNQRIYCLFFFFSLLGFPFIYLFNGMGNNILRSLEGAHKNIKPSQKTQPRHDLSIIVNHDNKGQSSLYGSFPQASHLLTNGQPDTVCSVLSIWKFVIFPDCKITNLLARVFCLLCGFLT